VKARYSNKAGARPPDWRPVEGEEAKLGDAIVASESLRLIEQAVREKRPFFVAAGFRKPHLPWVAPRRFFEMYPPAAVPAEPEIIGIPEIALVTELGRAAPASRAEAIAAYRACTSFIDSQAGRLLDALDRLKLWDTTIVVLFSDHGFHLGDHGGLWAKLTLFEQAARVPLIIAAPGIAPGTSPRNVELLDLAPTLTELAGLPASAAFQGKSLAPLLADPNAEWKRPAHTMVYHGEHLGKSIRTDRWRYTEWDGGKAGIELYDHTTDPAEYRNLAAEPAHAQTVAELKRLLSAGESAAP